MIEKETLDLAKELVEKSEVVLVLLVGSVYGAFFTDQVELSDAFGGGFIFRIKNEYALTAYFDNIKSIEICPRNSSFTIKV